MALHQVGSKSFSRANEKADESLLGATFNLLSGQAARAGTGMRDDQRP